MSKYSQYSYESPVTSLPTSCNYFNLLIFCQSSASNTIMNKATLTFNTFLSIYVFSPSISGFSPSCIISGKSLGILSLSACCQNCQLTSFVSGNLSFLICHRKESVYEPLKDWLVYVWSGSLHISPSIDFTTALIFLFYNIDVSFSTGSFS